MIDIAHHLSWRAGYDHAVELIADAIDDARHSVFPLPEFTHEERVQQRIRLFEECAEKVRAELGWWVEHNRKHDHTQIKLMLKLKLPPLTWHQVYAMSSEEAWVRIWEDDIQAATRATIADLAPDPQAVAW